MLFVPCRSVVKVLQTPSKSLGLEEPIVHRIGVRLSLKQPILLKSIAPSLKAELHHASLIRRLSIARAKDVQLRRSERKGGVGADATTELYRVPMAQTTMGAGEWNWREPAACTPV